MKYTIQSTVVIHADSENEAYQILRHALNNAKKAEIIHIDSEVISEDNESDD